MSIIKLKEYETGIVIKKNAFLFNNQNENISIYNKDNIIKEIYDESKNPHKLINLEKKYWFSDYNSN